MSSPVSVTCPCGECFIFLRGGIERCPKCGQKYRSHRNEEEQMQEEQGRDEKDEVHS
jgi:predicted  nucleic acid-binding Zn-ribbon protein